MSKAKQRIASIITTISVTGTLMASFPFTTSAAIVNENNNNKATNVDISLEDAANYAKDVAIEKNAADYGLCDNVKQGAILHAWCWSFNTIKENLHDIAEAGFTTVQTSPANQCLVGENGGMSIWSENGQGKWEYHYQPTDWKIGNYQLGTREEFKAMCEEADKYGIKIIVDVLPNHTTPQLGAVSQSLKDAAGGQDKLYHGEGFNSISRWEERYYCTNGAVLGLPDVNTENPGFQKYYLNYLNDLIDCGVDGFRYDTAKHIGLPDDPQDSKTKQYGWKNNFWPVALGNESVDGVSLHNKDKMFIYGEVLQSSGSRDGAYGQIMNLTASGYGYTLRGAISNKDFSVGRMSDWGNAAGASKLVTWVESHDTYCNNGESVFLSDWDIKMCWAIIAARKDGTPLFYSRPAGSTNNLGGRWGNNRIGAKGTDLFKDPEVAAVNKFRNAMVGEGETLRNPNGNSKILQIDRGTKGTVIINLGEATSINNETSMANGTYTDQVSGRTFTVSNGKISGQLDAGKIAVIYDAKTTKNPKVSATPGSGSFKGESVTLTLGLTNATTGTYTTSEGDSGSFKNGDKITVGSSISVGEKVTVTLKANGDDPESTPANETFTYTKKDGSVKKNTVYFTLPSGWSSPTIYAYSGDGTTATKITGEWPGTAMTSEGDGVYSYTFDDSVSSCKVIFASGSNQIPASQQPGFDYVGGKAYEYVSSWVEVPVTTPVEKGTVTVKYVDENGNDLTGPITLTGNVGDSYTTSKKTFSGYTLSSTPTNASGKYTKSGITVTYKYTKDEEPPIEEGKVIVNYVDSDGNKLSSVTLTGNVGDTYEAQEKTFSGYELVSIPSNASGTFKSTTITVTYRYEKIAADGKVVVKYIDEETQKEIAPSTTLTGKVGETYTTSSKQIEGYTLSFVPNNVSGTYKSTVTTVTYSYLKKSVVSNLLINSFTANKTSPQAVNTAVTFTTKVSGATGVAQYKYYRYLNGNYATIKDWSTSSSIAIAPSTVGKYDIYVAVKDGSGKTVRKNVVFEFKNQANLAISSFTANKISPQAVKTAVTFTTKVSGVTGTAQYKYYRYLNGNYATIKDWSTSSSIAIAPSTVGKYDIYVAVKDGSGKTVRKNVVFEFKNQANLAISSFTTNKTSPQAVKTAVTFTTKVSGVTGTVQYKYYRYLNGNYGIIKDWSTSSSIAIAPSTAGKYDIYVAVKDSSGKTVRKNVVFEFKNQANLAISSFTANKTSPQAVKTAVTLTTKVSGVTGTVQYKYYRYLNGEYGIIKDWSTNSSIAIAPSTAGKYDIYVAVKDGSGNTVRKNVVFTFR